MKKFFVLITLFLLFLQSAPSFAAQIKKVAVLPADIPAEASSYSIFPNTLSLISADIVNSLNKDFDVHVVDINKALNLISAAGIKKDYKAFVSSYKEKYIIDYDKLNKLSRVLGVDSLVLVSGGFDTTQMLFKKSLGNKLNLPWAPTLNPSYRLNMNIVMMDAKKSIVVYQDSFNNDFEMKSFDVPSQHFGENTVSISEIKAYSTKISPIIAYAINYNLTPMEETFQKDSFIPILKSRDGAMTKDGLQYPSNLIDIRKNNYKNWVLKQF